MRTKVPPSTRRSIVQCVIAEPPSDAGADHVTNTPFAWAGAATALSGAVGTVRGVAITPLDTALVPAALRANAQNVYAVPFARPVTVHDVAPDVVHDPPP